MIGVQMTKKRWAFYLSHDDELVRKMIVQRGHYITQSVDRSDAIIFTGGEDITPFLYGQKRLEHTKNNYKRDLKEIALFKALDDAMFPKIGICRGAQLLNVLSGGTMWQHVNNHSSPHVVRISNKSMKGDPLEDHGRLIQVPSDHHQMMVPSTAGDIIAAAKTSTLKVNEFRTYQTQNPSSDYDDVEMVYYWATNSLCCQPHPEYEGFNEYTDFFWKQVDRVMPQ